MDGSGRKPPDAKEQADHSRIVLVLLVCGDVAKRKGRCSQCLDSLIQKDAKTRCETHDDRLRSDRTSHCKARASARGDRHRCLASVEGKAELPRETMK